MVMMELLQPVFDEPKAHHPLKGRHFSLSPLAPTAVSSSCLLCFFLTLYLLFAEFRGVLPGNKAVSFYCSGRTPEDFSRLFCPF